MKRSRGFTLIELMITVAIIGILAMIAYPSYEQYVIRARRSAAQQFVLDVAQRLEQYLLDNRQYTENLGVGGLGVAMPPDVARDYNAPVVNAPAGARPPSFRITLTPRSGRMAGDGRLLVFSTTERWRDMDGDNAFTAGTDQPW